jgi:ribosomal protein L37E
MKKFTMIALAGGVLLGFLAGCKSTNLKLTDEEKGLLKSDKDLVISGKTGEIKGSSADKAPQKVVCKDCGFPDGSLRQRVIMSGEVEMDDETLKRLKANQDVIVSGKTGAIKGTEKDKKPNPVKCPGCGFPKGSLRERMIMFEEM